MLMIRLQRVGRKNDPSFRVVLTDRRNSTKSGRFLEVLGHYDFRDGREAGNHMNAERIKELIKNGAKPSDTLNNLLIDEKIISGKKINVLPSKTPIKKEEEKKEEKKPEEGKETAPVAPEGEIITETTEMKKEEKEEGKEEPKKA